MNIVWTIIMLLSLILLCFKDASSILSIMTESVFNSLTLLLSLFCIYAVWLGFLTILEKSSLNKKLTKLFSPLIKKLFGKIDSQTESLILINLTSNIIGAGNGGTPAGIKAMERLKEQKNNFAIITLFILNSLSLQLLPSTLIGILSANGASSPGGIILPIIIVSAITLTLALILVNVLYGKEKRK